MPNSGLIVSGKLGVNILTPANSLDVFGAAAIGTFAGIMAPTDGLIVSGNTGFGTASPAANVDISRASSATSGTAAYLQVDLVADTGLTGESPTVLFNFSSATRTWAPGTLAIQRYFNVGQPTLAFSGSSIATNVATMGIVGSPIQGGSASITNSYGILVNEGGTLSTGTYQWIIETAAVSNSWTAIAWSPQLGIFAALAGGGTAGNQSMVSTNGTTWTAGSAATSNTWTAIAWSPALGIFAAVANAGTRGNQVMVSTNGTTWILGTSSTAANWNAIAWSPSLNIFAAVSGVAIMTSQNGTTWTTTTSGIITLFSIVWAPAIGIFAGGGGIIWISSNGTSWTSYDSTPEAYNIWHGIAWSPSLGILVAVGPTTGTTQVITSSNGTSWTAQSSPANAWIGVAWSPQLGIFAAVADGGTAGNQIMISTNGTTWTTMIAAASNAWDAIAWSPQIGVFAAVADGGTAGNQVMILQSPITYSYGLSVNAQQGALNNYAAEFLGGAVTIGTATPDPSAILAVSSTSQGVLPPAMTLAQKNAMANPANGLMVYDSTANELNFYNGSNWIVPGLQLIASVVLSGTVSSVTFNNIPQTFNSLEIICMGRFNDSSVVASLGIIFNGDTGAHYNFQLLRAEGSSLTTTGTVSLNNGILSDWVAADSTGTYAGNCIATIPFYAQTNLYKTVIAHSTTVYNNSGTPSITEIWGSSWASTNAITSIQMIDLNGGGFVPGSAFYLYGEN